ncbi:MAG: hypothetical protein H0U75_01755 [Legionella sp.]|nr:hypothetical protein [Legionella sp.]
MIFTKSSYVRTLIFLSFLGQGIGLGNVYAQSIDPCLTQNADPICVLKKIKFLNLVDTFKVVNLGAQTQDPKGSTTGEFDNFNDFIAFGNVALTTHKVNFNAQGEVINKVIRNGRWMGVDAFEQKEIPALTFKEGFTKLQTCLKRKRMLAPSEEVTNVVIYKSLQGQFIYDYAFKIPGEENCQEILYIVGQDDCELGMQKSCHTVIQNSP